MASVTRWLSRSRHGHSKARPGGSRLLASEEGDSPYSKAEYIPTLVTLYQPGKPVRLYQVSAALKTAKGSFRRRLLDAQRRTTAVVTRKHPPGLTRS